MQEALSDLESRLDKLFGKGAPYQMSAKAKQALADATWIIVLIIGIMQAWTALVLWGIGHTTTAVVTYSNYTSVTYGNGAIAAQPGFFFYIAFLAVLVDAGLLLLAVPSLKDHGKHGWDLVYYALLLDVIYSFLRAFSNIGGGFGQFVVLLFFSAVAAYFLFQIRGIFVGGRTKATVTAAKHPDTAAHQATTKQPEDTEKK